MTTPEYAAREPEIILHGEVGRDRAGWIDWATTTDQIGRAHV